ncbi:MAG TPA: hypothetical protein VFF52_15460 [Isosphaeraceae bacterium]|nr:hypothetical protein [Isosphaeraceae bacterium]
MRPIALKWMSVAWFGLLMTSMPRTACADVIDFEQYTGPSTYAAAGNAQTLDVSTSIGTVVISGGVILTNATNLPADETSIYGTAGNAANIGVTTGSGFTNPLTITFPAPITNFFLDIINGNVIPVTYTLADNAGHSASFSIPPNTQMGLETFGFPATGSMVTVAATTGQSTSTGITWDFFIDNLHFDEPLPSVPEPESLVILATAALPIGLAYRWRKRRHASS